MTDLLIRPARPDDKDAVMEIAATIWDGNDYLPQVWDQWITESPNHGFLIAGDWDGRLAAIQHTSLQPERVAWMEGIRVHPELRGKGIGTRMLACAIGEAARRGATRARLSTAGLNEASSRAAITQGFEEIGHFYIFSAAAAPSSHANVRREKVTPKVLRDLRSHLGVTSHLMVSQWTAYDLPEQKDPADFPYSLIYEGDDGSIGVALGNDSRDGSEISLGLLLGGEAAVQALGTAFRNLAHELGRESVSGMFPRSPELFAGLGNAGYELNDHLEVLIFERAL